MESRLDWVFFFFFFETKTSQKHVVFLSPFSLPVPGLVRLKVTSRLEGFQPRSHRLLLLAVHTVQVGVGGWLWASLCRTCSPSYLGVVSNLYFYLCHQQGVLLDSAFILSKGSLAGVPLAVGGHSLEVPGDWEKWLRHSRGGGGVGGWLFANYHLIYYVQSAQEGRLVFLPDVEGSLARPMGRTY